METLTFISLVDTQLLCRFVPYNNKDGRKMEKPTKITNNQLLKFLEKSEILSDIHKEVFGDEIENDRDFEIYLNDVEFLEIVQIEDYSEGYDEFRLIVDTENETIKENYSTIEFSEVQMEMIFETVRIEKQNQTNNLRSLINEMD